MIKRFAVSIVVVFLILSGAIFGLAFKANKELERIVSGQFNEQQLVLARKIADDIEVNFQILGAALRNVSQECSRARADGRDETVNFPTQFDFLQDWGILGLGMAHPQRPESTIFLNNDWSSLEQLDIQLSDFVPLSASHEHPEKTVLLSRTLQPRNGPFANRWVMVMATPGFCPTDTTMTNHEDPLFVFILDAQSIARRFAQGVRSGQTGYPWVIDHKGYFMFHVEEEFIGQNSLTVRQLRNPLLSYQRINDLVVNRLLKGHEGMDWYISGWHWNTIGEIKKLLAFSPIHLSLDSNEHLWSVGLAAPDTEVYGLIRPMVLRQWLIVGLFFVLVMTSFAAFLYIALRWSEALQREVDKKTEHLTRSENELRKERDKVKESMDQLILTQEKLVLSERFAAIGEAAAHLSHEIKNPLMLIGGFAQQILRTLPEGDQRCEKLRIITEEAKRLEAMLMEVRDFTRPLKPKKSIANLNDTIREVTALLQESIQSQHIRLSLQLAADLPSCSFDADQIKQVLLNLTKNALEAMPKGGELTISSQVHNNHAHISVADTGEGISPDKIKRLFHPFFTTKQKGTGLGLAVSYKIIQDHDGDITVQSRKGKGSRFLISLPMDAKPTSNAAETTGKGG
ncbi:MAG TPA: two-component sensor histidine kinase [Desulfonatronum sp.]|nr:two-component sensor histidine kinase [Desulfonatronum sp.]